MKLTLQQIGEIKNFIQSRGITYLDVQMEVLDHVASAVEERMTADAQLEFKDALKQTHTSFGVFGFSTIEDAIVNGMGRRFRKVFWQNFSFFFHLKFIPLLLLSAFCIYNIQELLKEDHDDVIMSLVLITTLVSILVTFSLHHRKYSKFLTYRTSSLYLMLMGSFITLVNAVMSNIPAVKFVGINVNYSITTLILMFFVIYLIAAFKTVGRGIKESQLLIDKYEFL